MTLHTLMRCPHDSKAITFRVCLHDGATGGMSDCSMAGYKTSTLIAMSVCPHALVSSRRRHSQILTGEVLSPKPCARNAWCKCAMTTRENLCAPTECSATEADYQYWSWSTRKWASALTRLAAVRGAPIKSMLHGGHARCGRCRCNILGLTSSLEREMNGLQASPT